MATYEAELSDLHDSQLRDVAINAVFECLEIICSDDSDFFATPFEVNRNLYRTLGSSSTRQFKEKYGSIRNYTKSILNELKEAKKVKVAKVRFPGHSGLTALYRPTD